VFGDVLGVKLLVAGAGLALIETLSANCVCFRAPEVSGTAFLFAVLGLLVGVVGGMT